MLHDCNVNGELDIAAPCLLLLTIKFLVCYRVRVYAQIMGIKTCDSQDAQNYAQLQ